MVYPEVREGIPNYTGGYNEGVCSICTYLQSLGHKVKLMHITNKRLVDKEKILNEIAQFKPDLVGFSVMSPNFKYARVINNFIKKEMNLKTIIGGIHGILEYRKILENDLFDFVAIGEGECCLPELFEKMDDVVNNNVNVSGILTKKSNLNDVAMSCFVHELDSLPLCDRDFFDYPNLRDSMEKQAQFIAGRGCPFNCTYCANNTKREILGIQQMRIKSPHRVVSEIRAVLDKYGFLQSVFFQDDILTLNKNWFLEFVDLYKKYVGNSFTCNIHPMLISEEICEALSSIKCNYVQIGIESGNARVRSQILNRKMSNRQIKEKVRILRKHDIKLATFNIFGNYTETLNEALDTVKLNAEIKPDRTYSTVFIPYPGTQLNALCKENNLFIDGKEPEYYPEYTDVPIIINNEFSPKQVVFFVRYLYLLVLIYRIFPSRPIDLFLKSKYFPYKVAAIFIKWLRPKMIYLYLKFVVKYKSRFR